MKVRFWGCRGSIPRAKPELSRYGGNTPCIEVTSASGHIVVLDLGSGAFDLGVDLMKRMKRRSSCESGGANGESDGGCVAGADAGGGEQMRGTCLITHTHWDHIQGFPFFAPLFAPGFSWNVYGPRGLAGSFEETLSGQMQYEYFPVTINQLGAQVSYHDLLEGSFEVEGIRVKTHYLNHTVLTLGYLLESRGVRIAYITDHEPFDHRMAVEGYEQNEDDSTKNDDDRHVDFFRGVDLLVHDCQYTAKEYRQGKTGWGHSTVEYVVDVAVAAGVRQLALFHHDPNRTDDQVDELVSFARERAEKLGKTKSLSAVPDIYAAAEGLMIKFEENTNEWQEERKSSEIQYAGSSGVIPQYLLAQRKGGNISGKTVVVGLDCHSNFAHYLMEELEKDKLEVELCSSFDDVLEVSRRKRPSLLIMAQSMKGGSALKACAEIQGMGDWGKDVSFLIVAKNQNEMEKARAENKIVPTDNWIIEPLSAAYIRTRVRMCLLRSPCRWELAPIPKNEDKRLAALYDSCMLNVNNPDSLSRIARIAKQLFEVPHVCFGLLDEEVLKLISIEGEEITGDIPRDAALCSHAVFNEQALVVNDALEDHRFADSPVVLGEPFVRFYVGLPINVKAKDGLFYPIGTFCLIDVRPRKFNQKQMKSFLDLGGIVNDEFVILAEEAQSRKGETFDSTG